MILDDFREYLVIPFISYMMIFDIIKLLRRTLYIIWIWKSKQMIIIWNYENIVQ